jgi:hypothetical protein
MAVDSFGNPAEKAASGRLGSFVQKVLGTGTASMPDSPDDTVALMAEAELKSMAKSDQGQALAKEVSGYYSRVKAARLPFEREWLKNLDMLQGRQFTDWDPTKKRMVEQPKIEYEPRVVVNVIEPVIRTSLAKTGSTHPSVTVAPASNDDADVLAARAAESLWDWQYADLKFQSKVFNPANFWTAVTGNGFIKTWFDQTCEDKAATAAATQEASTSDSLFAGAGLSSAFGSTTAPTVAKPVQGKVRSKAVSPFHLYIPDLAEVDIEEQPYIIHAYPMNLQQAKQAYKDFVADDWSPTATNADTIISAYQLGLPGGNTSVPDTVVIVECYIKPGVSKNWPQGGVVVMIDETIVGASDGWPYEHGEFPFAHIGGIETGTFYRKSVIGTMIPLQNELNRTYAQIVKHRNIALKPIMFYDAGSVDPKRIQSKAGTWVPIALGANKPTAMPLQDLSSAFWNLIDKIKSEMDNISGQHDVSRSTAPGADTAASAIAALQEADNNFLFAWFDSIESVMETTARQTLSLMAEFWDQPRLVKIVGDDQSYDVQTFVGGDIAGNTDVRVEKGTGLPDSKAARIALITDWMKNQFIPVDVGMDALEMGTLGRLYRVIKVDQDQATRENVEMAQLEPPAPMDDPMALDGADNPLVDPPAVDPSSLFSQIDEPDLQQQAPAEPAVAGPGADPAVDPMAMGQPVTPEPQFPINSYDNDAVHVAIHERHMKGQKYQGYDPATKQIFEDHVAAHKARMQNLVAQQMQGASMQGAQAVANEQQGGAPAGNMQDQAAPAA